MQTRYNGTLTLRHGKRTLDGILVAENAVIDNHAEIYTYTTLSAGIITGAGTWRAHVTSRPIGGLIDVQQIVIYYPVDAHFVLPIVVGMLVSTKNTHPIEGELT
jgi:hypothetical protein